ncbi:hypothetical protein [Clostridium fungisolvens]|nr:hypothetical protein [Clostridium fungisolvens]
MNDELIVKDIIIGAGEFFCHDVEEHLPDNWHGEGFSIVQAIQDVALLFLRGQEIT